MDSEHDLKKLALYITRIVFQSLGNLFCGAEATQIWLTESARLITRASPWDDIEEHEQKVKNFRKQRLLQKEVEASAAAAREAEEREEDEGETGEKGEKDAHDDKDTESNKSKKTNPLNMLKQKRKKIAPSLRSRAYMLWTTPLGLPVAQPYRDRSAGVVRTQFKTVTVYDREANEVVSSQQQVSAFPPNFIHSLDASHMYLTTLSCSVRGIAFAAVHDSYWTHACDIDDMNTVLRLEFVRLHQLPIMENLRSEFLRRYGKLYVPAHTLAKAKRRVRQAVDKNAKLLDPNYEVNGQDEDCDEDEEEFEDEPVVFEQVPQAETSLRKRWVPFDLPPLPPRGKFEVQEVINSKYFFN